MSEKTIAHYFFAGGMHPYDANAMGLELELEQVIEFYADKIRHLRNIVEDHSLRNQGQEFISEPRPLHQALEFCKDVLHSKAVIWEKKEERCTERGSIHVHLNMQNMSVDDTVKMLRFYCLLEPQFFAEVEEHRRNNIYCVPLMATSMPRYIQKKNLLGLANDWHKYTALNVKPLREYGTLEFRHLQATDDMFVIEHWLRCILNLKQAAQDIRDANLTWEQVLMLHQRVFGKPATQLEDMEICFQEDLVNRQSFDMPSITMRVKEAKKCAA